MFACNSRDSSSRPDPKTTWTGRYSPLRPNGDGLQGIYLTEMPPIMATVERPDGEISTEVGNADIEM